jgi:hypothetical protein
MYTVENDDLAAPSYLPQAKTIPLLVLAPREEASLMKSRKNNAKV